MLGFIFLIWRLNLYTLCIIYYKVKGKTLNKGRGFEQGKKDFELSHEINP